MTIGYLEIELHIPTCHSLKEKRGVIKKHLHHIRTQYNVSAVELDGHDLWQKTILGIVSVSNNQEIVEKVFYKLINSMKIKDDINVINYHMEMF